MAGMGMKGIRNEVHGPRGFSPFLSWVTSASFGTLNSIWRARLTGAILLGVVSLVLLLRIRSMGLWAT